MNSKLLRYGLPALAAGTGLYGLTKAIEPSEPGNTGPIRTTNPFATTVAGSLLGAGLGGAAGYGFGDSRDAAIGAGLGAAAGGIAGYAGSQFFPKYIPNNIPIPQRQNNESDSWGIPASPILGGTLGAAAGYGFGGRRGALVGTGIGTLAGLGHSLSQNIDVDVSEAYPVGGALAGGALGMLASAKLNKYLNTPVKNTVIQSVLTRLKGKKFSTARAGGIGVGIGGAAGLAAYLSQNGYFPEGSGAPVGAAVLGSGIGALGSGLLKMPKGRAAAVGGLAGGIGGGLYNLINSQSIPEDMEIPAIAGYAGGLAGAVAGHKLFRKPIIGAVAGGGIAAMGAQLRNLLAEKKESERSWMLSPHDNTPTLTK